MIRNKPHNNQLCTDLFRFISAYPVVSHFLRFAWQTTLSEPELCVLIPEDFSKSVYSGWILKQTEKYLPDKLVIPGCIPELVGAVYSEPDNDEQQTAEYRKYSDEQKEKKQRAKKYCIPSQKINRSDSTLSDMINRRELNNDSDGEAAVRDGQETIEALVLVKTSDTEYSLFSRDAVFDITSVPDNAQAKLIAKQRLRLPAFFSKSYNFGKTIEILANSMPQAWRNAKWLKGEILLLLDGNNKISMLGRTYKYSTERGFEEIKEEENKTNLFVWEIFGDSWGIYRVESVGLNLGL